LLGQSQLNPPVGLPGVRERRREERSPYLIAMGFFTGSEVGVNGGCDSQVPIAPTWLCGSSWLFLEWDFEPSPAERCKIQSNPNEHCDVVQYSAGNLVNQGTVFWSNLLLEMTLPHQKCRPAARRRVGLPVRSATSQFTGPSRK